MSTTQSVDIEAPVEKVFGFFKEPRNWPTLAPPGLRQAWSR